MKEPLQKGLIFTHCYKVPDDKTVPYVFQEADLFQSMPPVFATAFMVGLMEWACMEALRPYMNEGEISLGTNISVTHTAATPPGMEVQVEVTLLEVNGARTKWALVATLSGRQLIQWSRKMALDCSSRSWLLLMLLMRIQRSNVQSVGAMRTCDFHW